MIIGVGSVIVFIVMGNGFMANVLADIETEEDPTLSVQTQQSASGFGWQLRTAPIYTDHDVQQLEAIDGVEYVAPDGWLSGIQIATDAETITGSLTVRATIPDRLTDEERLEGEPFASGNLTTFTVTGIVDDGDDGFTAQPMVYVPIDPHYTVTVETPRGTEERAYPFLDIRASTIDDRDAVQEQAREFLREESDASQLKDEESRTGCSRARTRSSASRT